MPCRRPSPCWDSALSPGCSFPPCQHSSAASRSERPDRPCRTQKETHVLVSENCIFGMLSIFYLFIFLVWILISSKHFIQVQTFKRRSELNITSLHKLEEDTGPTLRLLTCQLKRAHTCVYYFFKESCCMRKHSSFSELRGNRIKPRWECDRPLKSTATPFFFWHQVIECVTLHYTTIQYREIF